jgi:hypothetical protein
MVQRAMDYLMLASVSAALQIAVAALKLFRRQPA